MVITTLVSNYDNISNNYSNNSRSNSNSSNNNNNTDDSINDNNPINRKVQVTLYFSLILLPKQKSTTKNSNFIRHFNSNFLQK